MIPIKFPVEIFLEHIRTGTEIQHYSYVFSKIKLNPKVPEEQDSESKLSEAS